VKILYIFLLLGSLNDSGIWSNTTMKKAFEDNTISIPKDHPLPNTNCLLPFCLVGDEGFPLKTYLMRPFAKRNLQNNDQRIFNYRLSRARRVIENTFGILVSRWRILHKPLALKLSTVEKIIQAVTCLHNYIITINLANNQYLHEESVDQEDADGTIIPGNWRNVVGENSFINPLRRIGANVGSVAAIRQRETSYSILCF